MNQKTALITGSADRIGKEIALTLADMGYAIVIHYNRSIKKALELQENILAGGTECKAVQADLEDESEVKKLFHAANERQNLEILVNNASGFEASGFEQENCDLILKMMRIHLFAPLLLTKMFARHIKSGLIINMLDTNISKNKSDYLDYILSKKSLQELTFHSAYVLGRQGIRVNAIAPGIILPPIGKDRDYIEKKLADVPLGMSGTLQAIDRSIRYLVENEFVNGDILYVDGGEHL